MDRYSWDNCGWGGCKILPRGISTPTNPNWLIQIANLTEESRRRSLDSGKSWRTEEEQIDWYIHSFPSGVAIFVRRNISPFADRSYSSGLNGSDPEQMSEWKRMKTFPKFHRHLEYCLDCEPVYLQTYQIYKHIKATRTLFTHPY